MAAKTALEDARRQAADARRNALQASTAVRREALERQTALAKQRREARWLQTTYPVEVATRLLEWRRGLEPVAQAALAKHVRSVLQTQRCLRKTDVPELPRPSET